MALKRNERYPGRFSNPSSAHPQGAFKNRTAPDAQDGSYLEKDWANDWSGLFESLLSAASITPNGNVDEVGNSQYFNALRTLTLSRSNPFSDIASDGTVNTALGNLGLLPSATALTGTNGWLSIPSFVGGSRVNLIIQWGKGSYSDNQSVSPQIAFPNTFAAVLISSNPAETARPEVSQAYPTSLTQFVVGCAAWNGTQFVATPLNCNWIAIGW